MTQATNPTAAEERTREEIIAALRAWSPLIASGYEVPAASTIMNRAADMLARFSSLTAPASAVSFKDGVDDERMRKAAFAGWNACRKSIYAVCEDVIAENEWHRDDTDNSPRHHFGRGGMSAAKSIARGFNSMEAEDDDNLTAALRALTPPAAAQASTLKGGDAKVFGEFDRQEKQERLDRLTQGPDSKCESVGAASQDSGADGNEEVWIKRLHAQHDEISKLETAVLSSPETTDVRERAVGLLSHQWRAKPIALAEALLTDCANYIDTIHKKYAVKLKDIGVDTDALRAAANLLRTPDIAATGGASVDEIAEWRRLADAATKGPWLFGPLPDDKRAWPVVLEPEGRGTAVIADVFSEDDQFFIAAARTAVPKLIDALTAERERAEKVEQFDAFTKARIMDLESQVARLTKDLAARTKEWDEKEAECKSLTRRVGMLTHAINAKNLAQSALRNATARADALQQRVEALEEASRQVERACGEYHSELLARLDINPLVGSGRTNDLRLTALDSTRHLSFVLGPLHALTSPAKTTITPPMIVEYRNWRGETSIRRLRPIRVRHGSTKWHPEEQWLLLALDVDKGEEREFAMRDMRSVNAPDAGGA